MNNIKDCFKVWYDPDVKMKQLSRRQVFGAALIAILGIATVIPAIMCGIATLYKWTHKKPEDLDDAAKKAALLMKLKQFQGLTSQNTIFDFLKKNPEIINEKINYKEFKQVSLSHLLCSGKLFPEVEQILVVLENVVDQIDFSLLDESNLWGDVACFTEGTQGSGNNVLKSAVAAASASISGRPDRRGIVAYLLEYLDKNKDAATNKQLLDQGDHFVLGAHTIPEFLVRQGNEDLALKAIEMGGTITDDLLLSSLASAGTTEHGTKLAQTLLTRYVKEKRRLDSAEHWQARVCLSALPSDSPLTDLLNLPPEIPRKTWQYWGTIRFHECRFGNEGFMPFGFFSDQYRKNAQRAWDKRCEFVADENGKRAFQELHALFMRIPL